MKSNDKAFIFNLIQFDEILVRKTKELSEEAGRRITQKELLTAISEKTGFPVETMRHWKKGDNATSIRKASIFAEALGVCPEELGTAYENIAGIGLNEKGLSKRHLGIKNTKSKIAELKEQVEELKSVVESYKMVLSRLEQLANVNNNH